MTAQYNAPNGDPSSVDKYTGSSQIRTDLYKRKALVEIMDEQHFQPLASVTAMPKNMGKKIKQYLYLPILDDRNINDEGIDAAGVTIDRSKVTVVLQQGRYNLGEDSTALVALLNSGDNTAAAAIVAGSSDEKVDIFVNVLTNVPAADADTIVGKLNTTAVLNLSAAPAELKGGAYVQAQSGNIYGSSNDIGLITDKFPSLTEMGGRKNRVSLTRILLEGNLHKYGFFTEYTQESLDFDSDDELEMHRNREMLRGASKITEDLLQLDLINNAGIELLSGGADDFEAMDQTSVVTYGDLVRLGIALDRNHTPKKTRIITGSRMVDTRVIPAARLMFISSNLLPTLMQLTDYHARAAWVPVEQYGAAAGTIYNDEAGSIAGFRVIVVHDMQNKAGRGQVNGAGTSATSGFYATGNRFDVFPMLVVGDESFTTIGFQTGGAGSKFTVYHRRPGEGAVDHYDPYGERGIMSVKWYYGFMALRTERLAIQWTTARM